MQCAPPEEGLALEIERRQQDVLRQLDDLNDRIEQTIRQFAPATDCASTDAAEATVVAADHSLAEPE